MTRKTDKSPVTLVAVIKDVNTKKSEMLFEVKHSSGKKERLLLPSKNWRKPSLILEEFDDRDIVLDEDRDDAIATVKKVLEGYLSFRRMNVTSVSGWTEDGDYVVPDKTYCASGHPTVRHRDFLLQTAHRSHSGMLLRWKKGVAPVLNVSSYATVAVGLALAGPILRFFEDQTGVVVNYSGPSQTGKTSVGKIAQSVVRSATKLDGTNMTYTGLEESAFEHNDSFMVLDEVGGASISNQATERQIEALAKSIWEGRGRKRANAHGSKHLTWTVSVLTTSEKRLSDLAERSRMSGEINRFIDVDVPSKDLGGVIDLKDCDRADASELIRKSNAEVEASHGACINRFLSLLTRHVDEAERILGHYHGRFVRRASAGSGCDSSSRSLDAFAKIYAALCLGVRFKVLPISEEHAERCVMKLFLRSEEQREADRVPVESIMALNRHLSDPEKCPEVPRREIPEKPVRTFCRNIKGSECYCIYPDELAAILHSYAAVETLEDFLIRQGIQIKGPGGKNRRGESAKWITGNDRVRLIVLDKRKFRRFANSLDPATRMAA